MFWKHFRMRKNEQNDTKSQPGSTSEDLKTCKMSKMTQKRCFGSTSETKTLYK